MLNTKQVTMCTYVDLFSAIAKITGLDAWTVEEALGSNNSFVEDRAHDVIGAEGLIEGLGSEVDEDTAQAIARAIVELLADLGDVHFV